GRAHLSGGPERRRQDHPTEADQPRDPALERPALGGRHAGASDQGVARRRAPAPGGGRLPGLQAPAAVDRPRKRRLRTPGRRPAVLVATHNVEIVTRLQRRVLTLVQGRLVRDQPAGLTGRMAWLASSQKLAARDAGASTPWPPTPCVACADAPLRPARATSAAHRPPAARCRCCARSP